MVSSLVEQLNLVKLCRVPHQGGDPFEMRRLRSLDCKMDGDLLPVETTDVVSERLSASMLDVVEVT